MLERLLRTVAVVASLTVLVGWGLFALGEARSASERTTVEIAGREASGVTDPSPEEERARERAHTGAREAVDDVNDVLLAHFAAVTQDAGDIWVRRSIPALLGLLVYGLGLGTLARFAAGR